MKPQLFPIAQPVPGIVENLTKDRVDFSAVAGETRLNVISAIGSEQDTIEFFQNFRFLLNQPNLAELESGLYRRFMRLGGEQEGWLHLKDLLRKWVVRRGVPNPDNRIYLDDIKQRGTMVPSSVFATRVRSAI